MAGDTPVERVPPRSRQIVSFLSYAATVGALALLAYVIMMTISATHLGVPWWQLGRLTFWIVVVWILWLIAAVDLRLMLYPSIEVHADHVRFGALQRFRHVPFSEIAAVETRQARLPLSLRLLAMVRSPVAAHGRFSTDRELSFVTHGRKRLRLRLPYEDARELLWRIERTAPSVQIKTQR